MTPRRAFRWGLIVVLLLPALTLLDRDQQTRPPHTAAWFETAGVRWRGVRTGTGPPLLVMLHGFGEHLLTWRALVDPLSRHAEVLAVDWPGFGGSDKPDSSYSLQAMADRLEALLERWTSDSVVLVAHSMGGAVAVEAALRHPDRIQALVLIAPAGLQGGLGELVEMAGARGAAAGGIWEAVRSFLTPVHDPGWLAEEGEAAAYDPGLDPAYRSSSARVLREFDFEGVSRRFGELTQPVLLIWGRFDPVIPFATADSMAGLIPCVHLAPLNALHRPQVERPDTVIALIRSFLADPYCH